MASCSFSTLLERVTACGLSSCYPGYVEVVSLKELTRHISRRLQLHGLNADKAVDSEFKLLLARAGNVISFCSVITVFHDFGHRYFWHSASLKQNAITLPARANNNLNSLSTALSALSPCN